MRHYHSFAATVLCAVAITTHVAAQASRQAECRTSWPGWKGVKYIFTFGDSYSQTGFNPSGTQPTVGNPLGNPPYPGWTSSNGPNWIDYLTVEYNASTVLTYNLADGGATIDAALAKPWKPDVLSLIDQVQKRFLKKYASKPSYAPWSSENTLFAFWIGINDVGNTYWDKDQTKVNKMFKEYSDLIEQVYATGARNFVFLGVPPLQRAPLNSGNAEGVTLEDKAVRTWNSNLIKMSDSLRARHPDVTSFVFSTMDVYNKVLDNPVSYPQTKGLKDTKAFCEGSGKKEACKYAADEYFWYNNLHPTSPIHKATAAELAKLLAGWPANAGKTCSANAQILKVRARRHGHSLHEFY